MSSTPRHLVKEMPTITIGVTTYDRPDFLRECLNSILAQTYENFDIIIANDFTETPVTFESLGMEEDSRIEIINHERNIGAYQNNYFLIEKAAGDWFTWLADDDLMHPKFLELACEALVDSDALSFFCGYAAANNPDGIFEAIDEPYGSLSNMNGPEFIGKYADRTIRAVGSYGVYKRKIIPAISKAPRFGTGLAVYVDTYIPVIAASMGPVAYRDVDLIFLRDHTGSQSASSSRLGEYASAQQDFLEEFRRRCEEMVSRKVFEGWCASFLWWFAQDDWHVAKRGADSVAQRIAYFTRCFWALLRHHAGMRVPLSLYFRVSAMVVLDALRELATTARGRKCSRS